MPGGDDPTNGGRVTTREFYDALLQQNKDMTAGFDKQNGQRADMERRIIGKMDNVCKSVDQHEIRIENNEDEVKILRTRSNWLDIGLGAFTIFMAGLNELWRRNG